MTKFEGYIRKEEEERELELGGAKFDKGKERYDLIPGYPLNELVKIYTYGAMKYSPDNYLNGMQWRRIIGAIFRHLYKWLRGEVNDEESGIHHLAHVCWNLFTLMIYEKNKIGVDDRNPYLLDMLPDEEQDKKINKWKELSSVGKSSKYNGLEY